MVRMAVALALALVGAGGCGKNKAVKRIERFADAVCACPDAPCAREVWTREYRSLLEKVEGARGSAADREAIRAAGERLRACQARLK